VFYHAVGGFFYVQESAINKEQKLVERKEGEGMKTKEAKWCKKLTTWLSGMSLEEKIKTLESGKSLRCVYCGLIIFDKQINEDLSWRRCRLGHDFIEFGNYTILSRNFAGLDGVIWHESATPLKEAIIDHFKRKSK